MINNNTTPNTNVNIGTTSQSTPYLKKSELPKVVSAFDNDKGYLTTSTLETWLMKHSYIPKSDIEKIVNTSKDQIIEIVDNSTGGSAVNKLEGYIEGNKKEIVEIKDRLNSLDTNIGELQDKSKTYLTKHQDLSEYAKISSINDINNQLNKVDSRLATLDSKTIEMEIFGKKNYLTEESIKDYAKKTELNSVSAEVKILKSNQNTIDKQLQEFATVSSLADYIKTDTLTQTLKDYAKITTLNSQLAGYTKTSVFNSTLKNYVTKDSVYTKNNINGILTEYLKIKDAKNTYVPRDEIENTYITIKDATNSFLTIEDYRGLKDASTINTQYKDRSLDDLRQDLSKDINLTMNGFYIVNKNDVVIVKDKEIINIFKDGVPQANLVWTEEE